ncbi:restriction endonuclease [Alistipes onderdonkii]|nr:restriction endonuclease [Alistipes onderdonkii]KAA2708109.1 restriction endonuclease [Alistipes onderdonkii]KAA2752681.1 restriction endonuclease [Alistipes onderdonkii]KAA2755594.1 restriction endonuclease [Alistipes onderdonkii]KAA2833513.1 restriction endonuclease [Alistipes onderdonkii]
MDYKFLSNVEKLPKRRIGDIALIKAGGDCPQEWSKYKTKDYQIPIYSNGTDNEGLYGYTKEPVILKRSVTVAARGTIGYCEIREGGYVPIIRLLAVTPNDIGGDVYLHQVFNRIKFKNDGSIQQQLTVPSIASIEIPYPDASALKTFANITYPFIEKIKLNKIQIEELTKQRDKLLPLLMNGQVSVNSDLSVCINLIIRTTTRICSYSNDLFWSYLRIVFL